MDLNKVADNSCASVQQEFTQMIYFDTKVGGGSKFVLNPSSFWIFLEMWENFHSYMCIKIFINLRSNVEQ